MRPASVPIIATLLFLALLAGCGPTIARIGESRQATGVKVGEVTDQSAIVWVRLTDKASRRRDGIERRGRPQPFAAELGPADLEGSSLLARRARCACATPRAKTSAGPS